MLEKQLQPLLENFTDPYLGQSWGEAKVIKSIKADSEQIQLDLVLPYPALGWQQAIVQEIHTLLAPLKLTQTLKLNLQTKISAHQGKAGVQGLANIKNIIAVASGKGGVGKSTVAVNLAIALAQEGAQVGLLDADIYGPSQPMMLGAQGTKPAIEGGVLQPIVRHGIQSMSIGYLIESQAAMMWRGPMLGKVIQQMIHETAWQDLDYLIVDLPPGTGDVQLTLCQKMPLTGAVIVTTPQDLALLDVKRACEMFKQLNIPLLGVIENMSFYHCVNCGHEESLFGQGGAQKLAEQYTLPLLGKIPLAPEIREQTDSGAPPASLAADAHFSQIFRELARHLSAQVARLPKDYSRLFPKINLSTS